MFTDDQDIERELKAALTVAPTRDFEARVLRHAQLDIRRPGDNRLPQERHAMRLVPFVRTPVREPAARNDHRLLDSAQQIANVGILDEMIETELDHVPLPRGIEQVNLREGARLRCYGDADHG